MRQNTVHYGSGPLERAIRKTQVAKGEFAFVLPKGEGKLHINRDAGRKHGDVTGAHIKVQI